MSDSFNSSNGAWDTAADWTNGALHAVPAAGTPVTIGANTTLITVGGVADAASYITVNGAVAGGAGNELSVTGTLSLQGGTENTVTDFNVVIGSTGYLDTDQILFSGSSVEIYGKDSFSGGGSTLSNSTLTVEAGGILIGDQLTLSNALEKIYGSESLTNGGGGVLANGTIIVEAGGIFTTQELNGTSTDQLVVDGTLNLTGGGPGVGMSDTINAGGIVNMAGYEGAGTSWTINGGTFASSVSSQNGNFNFSGTGGVLDLSQDSKYNTGITVSGFNATDALILGPISGIAPVTSTIVNGNTLELIQNNQVVGAVDSFTLASGTTPAQIQGTIVNGQYVVNYCFYAGTRLAGQTGEIEVQHIIPGTMLKTAAGAMLPVRWVGRSEISTRFADPLRALPIRIKAGALTENLPVRDLLVSPDHALFLGGVLVQAAALVNNVSIIREHDVPECFTYYHVELATHELLLAEGVAAESFVDNVDRMNFHNWDERDAPRALVPEMAYPRAKSARQLPGNVRQALAARAEAFAAIHAA